MLALHLSSCLAGTPPPEILQSINSLVHREPYDRIMYTGYWFLVLVFLAPVVGMLLPFMLLWDYLFRVITRDRFIEPAGNEGRVSSGISMKYAVVISGCDSGIGKELALCLAAEGFVIFAGCLQKESLLAFSGMDSSIHPVLVDVTCEEHVVSLSRCVAEWLQGGESNKERRVLHSLVNNAGVGIAGYCDWLDVKDYEHCMNVNYFGVIRMTKAFLPILKKQAITGNYSCSQIVNVVSVSGMLSAGGLAASTYEGSKHAAEAFTNALRLEMKMYGIHVVALNPSFFDTPLTNNVKERLSSQLSGRLSTNTQEEYGKEFIEKYIMHCETMMTSGRWELKVLIDSIVRIVKSKYPPAQLMVGLDCYVHATICMLPQWARHWIVQLGIPSQIPAVLKTRT